MFTENTTMLELMNNNEYWDSIIIDKGPEEKIESFPRKKDLKKDLEQIFDHKINRKYLNSKKIKNKIRDKRHLFFRGIPSKRPAYYTSTEKAIVNAGIVQIDTLSESIKTYESKEVWVTPIQIKGKRIKRHYSFKEEDFSDIGNKFKKYGKTYFRSIIHNDPLYDYLPLEYEVLEIYSEKPANDMSYTIKVGEDKEVRFLLDFKKTKIHFYKKRVYDQSFCNNICISPSSWRGWNFIPERKRLKRIIWEEELAAAFDLDKNYAEWEYEDGILADWEKEDIEIEKETQFPFPDRYLEINVHYHPLVWWLEKTDFYTFFEKLHPEIYFY